LTRISTFFDFVVFQRLARFFGRRIVIIDPARRSGIAAALNNSLI